MMMSATCNFVFSPIQIPEKGIFGAKTWFFYKKMSKLGILKKKKKKKMLVVTVEYIKMLKVRYESKVITGKK